MLADLLIKKYDKFMQKLCIARFHRRDSDFNKRNGRFHLKSSQNGIRKEG